MSKINLKADIPLVGCLANDTENLFTGGRENSSEEIRKVTGVTGAAGTSVCLSTRAYMRGGERRGEKEREREAPSIHQYRSAIEQACKQGRRAFQRKRADLLSGRTFRRVNIRSKGHSTSLCFLSLPSFTLLSCRQLK